ncbi:DUF3888 domain-containing protein [Anaeropeptidivorans aminofermentans]|uniref:DUF3888 domain-containing protein n=1 Tax=Anaeropeptidivorans aminofermentans TaxID=2934315 RepID=UPI002024DB65|nr:DUF3888 domain-containing protein [Anaeropeptidivorans aminofermentans]
MEYVHQKEKRGFVEVMHLFRLLKENKMKIVLLLILLDVILIFCLFVKTNIEAVMTASIVETSNTREKYNQLLVNTYLTKIEEASNDFYDEYYTTSPIINYYSVFVKDITSNNTTYYVTFISEPYLGPHDTIGIDEITFSADYLGNVKPEKFNHIISYKLPDNLKELEKKRVPGKYSED